MKNLTICPETITELIRFEFLRCKNYVTAPEINSPRGPKSPDITVRKSFKSPVRITAPKNNSKTISRSAPKGRQQMGETGFCKNLRFSAVSCENLRFPAVFCANLRLPNPLIYRASRKSAKICKNLRKCAFRVRFLPFAVSLLARPENFL